MRHAAAMAALRLIALGVLVAAAPAIARPVPREVAASYNVTRGAVQVAIVQERFEAVDRAFHIISETSPVGLFALVAPRTARFSSRGRITERGLQPERFEAGRGDDDPRRVSAEFDWPQSRLTIRHDGHEDTLPLPPGAQDRLSAMYQFMFMALDELKSVEFAMTNGRKLDRYHYTVTPGVELLTPLGRIATVHLAKRRDPGDTATELWLSPAHGYLPLRMVVVENDGARYEQIITRLDVLY